MTKILSILVLLFASTAALAAAPCCEEGCCGEAAMPCCE
jgi:hypothetical protein